MTNEKFGSISLFDGISYYAFLFLIKDFILSSSLKSTYFFLFCILTTILFAGSIQSEFIGNSLINLLKYVSVFIYAKLLIDECIHDVRFVSVVIKCLKFVCLTSIAFLIIQLFAGLEFSFYPELNPNTTLTGGTRYPSFFFDPQIYAQFLAMSSFLFLIRTGYETPAYLLYNRLLFCLVIFVIFLTGGRAGFLGLCVGLVVIFLSGKSKFRFFIVICCLLGYLVITFSPQNFVIFNREEGFNESFEVRLRIWSEAYNVFIDHLFFGIGIGDYRDYSLKHSENGYYIIDNEIVYYGTESGYLKILAECGILGFLTIFSFILMPIVGSLKSFLRKKVNYNIFYLIAAIASWMIPFFSSNTLDDKRIVVLLATFLCLLIATVKSAKAIYE